MADVGMMAHKVLQYLLELLRNPEAQEAYAEDPEGELARNGLEDATGEDVYDAVNLLGGQLPPEACDHLTKSYLQPAASISSGASSTIAVSQTGAPPPPALEPAAGETGLEVAAKHISYVTNNYSEITNTTIDNSINQIAYGDITQALAYGDGSIANTGMMEGAFNTGEVSGVMAGGDVYGAAVGEGATAFGGDAQGVAVGEGNTVIGGDAGNVNVGGYQTNVADSHLQGTAFGEGDASYQEVATHAGGDAQVAVGDYNTQAIAGDQHTGAANGDAYDNGEPGYEPEGYEPPAEYGYEEAAEHAEADPYADAADPAADPPPAEAEPVA